MSRQSRQIVENRIDRKEAARILSISQRTLDRHIKNKRVYSRKANGRVWLDKEDVLKFKAARETGSLETPSRQHRDVKSTQNDGIIIGRHDVDTSSHRVDKVDIDDTLTNTQKKVLSQLEQQVLHNDKIEESVIPTGSDYAFQREWGGVVKNVTHHMNNEAIPVNNHMPPAGRYQLNTSMPGATPYNVIVTSTPEQAAYNPLAVQPQTSGQFAHYYSEGVYQKLYEELKKEHRINQKRIESANYKVVQLEAQLEVMIPLLEYKKQKEKYRKLESGLKNQVHKREIQLKKARRMYRAEQFNKWVFAIIALGLIVMQPVIWLLQN